MLDALSVQSLIIVQRGGDSEIMYVGYINNNVPQASLAFLYLCGLDSSENVYWLFIHTTPHTVGKFFAVYIILFYNGHNYLLLTFKRYCVFVLFLLSNMCFKQFSPIHSDIYLIGINF